MVFLPTRQGFIWIMLFLAFLLLVGRQCHLQLEQKSRLKIEDVIFEAETDAILGLPNQI